MNYAIIVLEKEKQLLTEIIERNKFYSKAMIEIQKEMLYGIDKAISILKDGNNAYE